MRGRPGLPVIIAVACISLMPPASAAAQDAEEIMRTAFERYEQRMSSIDNYTLVQDVMGFETTSYFEKEIVDGRTVFKLVDSIGDDSQDDVGEMYAGFMEVAERAEYSGKDKVDGRDTFVLTVDDFSGLSFYDEDDDFKPKKGKFYLDTGDYVIRRVVMEGTIEQNGQMQPATADMLFEDYRAVEGMLHPFLVKMSITGVTAGLSEEELEEARKNLAEMRKQLEEMPESQRKMVESMMGSQIEKLEEMVESGNVEVSVAVKELRVNQGPPK